MTATDAYKAFEKLPRPLLRWLCLAGVAWVFGICDIAGHPMDNVGRAAVLGFVCAVYGIRGWEKVKEMSL